MYMAWTGFNSPITETSRKTAKFKKDRRQKTSGQNIWSWISKQWRWLWPIRWASKLNGWFEEKQVHHLYYCNNSSHCGKRSISSSHIYYNLPRINCISQNRPGCSRNLSMTSLKRRYTYLRLLLLLYLISLFFLYPYSNPPLRRLRSLLLHILC